MSGDPLDQLHALAETAKRTSRPARPTDMVTVLHRLNIVGARRVTVTDVDDETTCCVALFASRAHAHAAANSFFVDHRHTSTTVCVVWPTPHLTVRFEVDETPARHRLPGMAKQGPKHARSVLSGRHVDETRAVA